MRTEPAAAAAPPPPGLREFDYVMIEGPVTLDLCKVTFRHGPNLIPGAEVAAAIRRLKAEREFPLRPECAHLAAPAAPVNSDPPAPAPLS